MKKIYSFPPIVNESSKILILGTMPGKDSLRLNQYYANSRNSFWKIMFALFDKPFTTDYAVRKKLLLDHHVAIWDTLKACRREGSLDASISDGEPNDLVGFLAEHPNIRTVFCNGKDAAMYFRKQFLGQEIQQFNLPSTSAAHAIGWERKLKEWSVILQHIK